MTNFWNVNKGKSGTDDAAKDAKDTKEPDFSNVQSGSSSTSSTTYVVVSGDSLSKIAQREYGDAAQWNRIYEANRDKLKDPDKIFPGQKLNIPSKT